MQSEHRVNKDLERCFNEKDLDHDGALSKSEMTAIIKEMNASISHEEIEGIWTQLDTDKSNSVDKKEFIAWYKSSPVCAQMLEHIKEAEEGISLCPLPDTVGAKIKYFFVLPLVFLMCISMPDVRKEKCILRPIH